MTEVEQMLQKLRQDGGGIGSRGISFEEMYTEVQSRKDITLTTKEPLEHAMSPRWSLIVLPNKWNDLHTEILRMAIQMCEEAGVFEEIRQKKEHSRLA